MPLVHIGGMLEAFMIAIASAIGTAFAAWLLDRWLDIRGRWSRWREAKRSRVTALDDLLARMPNALGFIEDARTWQQARDARDLRTDTSLAQIAVSLEANTKATHEIQQELKVIRATSRAKADADHTMGYFECAVSGGITEANETFQRRMKCGEEDLLDWRFLNFVHPEDRDRVKLKWDQARRLGIEFRERFRTVATDGQVWLVDARATPIPPGEEPVGWIGFVHFLDSTGIDPALVH